MDYPDFLILRLRGPGDSLFCGSRSEISKKIKRKHWLNLLPGKQGIHIRQWWMMWKMPIEIRATDCLGQQGEEVLLPFSEDDLSIYTKEEITDMLHRIIMEKGVQNMVVDAPLDQFLEKGLRIDGGMIPLLMLDEIVKHICKKHQIAKRELKPVVMAASVQETFYVLRKLGTDLNRLTIVTEAPELYEDFVRESYEEQGLLVRVIERPLRREVYGNLIIELSPRYRKDYFFYSEGSVVLNLSGNRYQIQDIIRRRQNLICYNRFDISIQGAVQDNRVLQAVIYKTNTQIGAGQLEKGEKIKEIYGFKVEKTGIQS